jgi:hypothetical protein
VEGCYSLICSLCDYVKENKEEIRKLIKTADNTLLNRWSAKMNTDSFSFDYRVVPTPDSITIKIYDVVKDPNPDNYIGYLPTDVKKTVTLPYLADYVPNSCIKVH